MLFNIRFLGPKCTFAMSLVSMLLFPGGLRDVGVDVTADALVIFAGFSTASVGVLAVGAFPPDATRLSATSLTTIPNIQQFIAKKARLAANRPGTNVLLPRNSS